MQNILLVDEYLQKARKVKAASREAVFNTKKISSSRNSFYYSSTPKEAVFRVIRNYKNGPLSGYSVKRALLYIGSEKDEENIKETFEKIDLEQDEILEKYNLFTHDGRVLKTKKEIDEIYEEWEKTFSSNKRENGKDAEHILFSTSEPSSKEVDEKILAAAKKTLEINFRDKGYDYVLALHKDKEHTHVHAIVRTYNTKTQKQLRILKQDIKEIRSSWANHLQEQGLNYVVSINLDKIKDMSERLEIVEAKNNNWFRENIEKLKSDDIDELGKNLLSTQEKIKELNNQKTQIQEKIKNIFYDTNKTDEKNQLKTELKLLDKEKTKLYADFKAYLKLLNEYESNVQIANKNYNIQKENLSKISGFFITQSLSYKNLEEQTEIARQILLQSRISLDKAHFYLNQINLDKKYTISLDKQKEINYTFQNIQDIIKSNDKSLINNQLIYNINELEKKFKEYANISTYLDKKAFSELLKIKENVIKKTQTIQKSILPIKEYLEKNKDILSEDKYNKLISRIEKIENNLNADIPSLSVKDAEFIGIDTSNLDRFKQQINYKEKKLASDLITKQEFVVEELEKSFTVENIDLINLNLKDVEFKEDGVSSFLNQIISNNIKTPTKNTQDIIQTQEKINISSNEIETLKQMTLDELRSTNPKPVLDALGITYKEQYGRLTFKAHAERTASSNMYLDKAGEWKYKNFSTGAGGTVENVIMDITGMQYKEALNYATTTLGTRNYLDERFEDVKYENSILKEEHLEKIKKLKEANINYQKESSSESKVVKIEEIYSTDKEVMEFLSKRGIENIADGFYKITGQYEVNGKTFYNIGIGVLTNEHNIDSNLEEVGADIHLLKPITLKNGNVLKTMSFGNKDITVINNKDINNKIAIFESKMDYAAAYSQDIEKFENTTSIIANGTGNYFKIIQELEKLNAKEKEVLIYNQNDKAGDIFVTQILAQSKINKFDFIKYSPGEDGKDINDLIKDKVNIEDRFLKNNTLIDFISNSKHKDDLEKVLNENLNIESNQISSNIKISKDDINSIMINRNSSFKDSIKKEDTKNINFEEINKILKIREEKNSDKANSYSLTNKEKATQAAKQICYSLYGNLQHIKDTKKHIDNIKNEHRMLELLNKNLSEYEKATIELNKNLNEFISNVNKSKFTREEKIEINNTIFESLNKINYSNNILENMNSLGTKGILKNIIRNRDIEEYRNLSLDLYYVANSGKKVNTQLDKADIILKRIKAQELSLTDKLKIKAIQNHIEKSKNLHIKNAKQKEK